MKVVTVALSLDDITFLPMQLTLIGNGHPGSDAGVELSEVLLTSTMCTTAGNSHLERVPFTFFYLTPSVCV